MSMFTDVLFYQELIMFTFLLVTILTDTRFSS